MQSLRDNLMGLSKFDNTKTVPLDEWLLNTSAHRDTIHECVPYDMSSVHQSLLLLLAWQ